MGDNREKRPLTAFGAWFAVRPNQTVPGDASRIDYPKKQSRLSPNDAGIQIALASCATKFRLKAFRSPGPANLICNYLAGALDKAPSV